MPPRWGLQWATRAGSMDDPKQSHVVGKIDWIAPPQGGGRFSADGYSLSAFSKQDPDTLFRIVATATNDAAMREASGLTVPTRTSILEDPEMQKKNRYLPGGRGPRSKTALPFPQLPEFYAVGEFIARRIVQAVTGEMEVKPALDAAAVETEAFLKGRGYLQMNVDVSPAARGGGAHQRADRDRRLRHSSGASRYCRSAPIPDRPLVGTTCRPTASASARAIRPGSIPIPRRSRTPHDGMPGPPMVARPGTDLAFLRRQHLDAHNIVLGIVNPLTPSGQGLANPGLSVAMCHATNEWQVRALVANEPRLRASIVVPYEDPAASAAEIERYAGNPAFAQVLLLGRTGELLGQRRYRPIFRAAVRAGLPVALHAFGYSGQPVTPAGWPSFYIEEMTGHAQCAQAQLSSLVLEGAFEELPGLKVIIVEAGFAWLPSLAWRLDRNFDRLRSETPGLRRLPSEYLHDQVWLTTQPMEEPEPREHLLDTIGWIGWDRLLFATDYPHWDFDDPAHALPLRIGEAERHAFFIGNARALYGIG